MRKNTYNFKEVSLPSSFRSELTKQSHDMIEASTPFTLIGIPAVGMSFFLKFLALNPINWPSIKFVHVNIYELHSITKLEFLRVLASELGTSSIGDEQKLTKSIKERLVSLSKEYQRVVLIFNRFDQLKRLFDLSFFNFIHSLRELNKEKIVLIFSSHKPLIDIAPKAVSGANMFVFSKSVYFLPYNKKELLDVYLINNPKSNLADRDLEKVIKLSGGHHQLFVMLLNSERFDDPLLDKFIRLRLKEIFDTLSYGQKNELKKLATGKEVEKMDSYLVESGLVKKTQSGMGFFTPLLRQYILTFAGVRLPVKESKLFKLLLRNIEVVVSKEEIFKAIWGEGHLEASDWALNSLVYRLKKNAWFVTSGYVIENQKKQGYVMYRS